MSLRSDDFQSDIAKRLIAKRLIAQGLEQGLKQGLEAGQREVLRLLLTQRFGPLAPRHEAKLFAADSAQLARFTTRLLSADGIDAALAED